MKKRYWPLLFGTTGFAQVVFLAVVGIEFPEPAKFLALGWIFALCHAAVYILGKLDGLTAFEEEALEEE